MWRCKVVPRAGIVSVIAEIVSAEDNLFGYFSLAGERCKAHSDGHDVFAYQVAGRKRWWFEDGENLVTSPGQAVWIKSGTPHQTLAVTDSFHVTLPLTPRTGLGARVRDLIPIGFDRYDSLVLGDCG